MRKRVICITILLILFLVVLVGIGLYSSKYILSVSTYTIPSSKVSTSIRVVQLTDLHNSEFNTNNCKLVERVAEQSPDLIMITGDLLNQDVEKTDIATGLIKELKDIAPVYVSFGNHEVAYEKKYGIDLRVLYTEAGATVLEYNQIDITVNGQQIRIGGLYGYCLPAKYLKTGEAWKKECDFLEGFQDTDALTLYLAHRPSSFLLGNAASLWNIDVVMSGHEHGGQVILPYFGGFFSRERGYFPDYTHGNYVFGDTTMIVTSGLGSDNEPLPRFNNPPEIILVTVQ